MMIALHKNARTTPAVRAEIAASTASAAELAQGFGIPQATVYKWRSRTSFGDASHTAHRLQTTLNSAQERIVVELRRTLLLPLDDLLAVTREFLCEDGALRPGPVSASPRRGQPQRTEAPNASAAA
jgi:transposase-like protein